MTVTDPTIAQALRSFIQENFLYMRPDLQYADDDSLLAKGVIDSLGVMEIVGFLEEHFEMTVEQDDVTEQNFGSVAAIARYVAAKRGA
jgi:acyl carrier protein